MPTSSGRQALDNSKNNFERGQVDVFTLSLPNLGAIKKLLIGHDDFGAGADWHLAEVKGGRRGRGRKDGGVCSRRS